MWNDSAMLFCFSEKNGYPKKKGGHMRLSKVFSMLKMFSGIALASGALVITAGMNVKAATESENNGSC